MTPRSIIPIHITAGKTGRSDFIELGPCVTFSVIATYEGSEVTCCYRCGGVEEFDGYIRDALVVRFDVIDERGEYALIRPRNDSSTKTSN